MPPEAISRSSTYFPKIWGNTRLAYRTALLAVWLGTACTTPPPEITARTIRASWVPECAPSTTTGQLDVEALGDFDPSAETHVVVGIAAHDSTVGIPDSTRALMLGAETAQGSFRGVAAMPEAGDVPVSLWPTGRACALSGVPDERAYPPDLDGVAIGYSPSASVVLLVGGTTEPTSALVVDVAKGTAAPVDSAFGPRRSRIGATVTPFGSALLVAGGSGSDIPANDSADVFDPVSRRFEQAKIDLAGSRANHAAVVLASGETLLVGGSNEKNPALRELEIVSPETRTYRLEILKTGRTSPRALRLTDDRILVAGGFAADGFPIDTLEWLSADATSREPQSPALTRVDAPPVAVADRGFVAMPGGSALAVGGCQLGPIAPCVPCSTSAGAGCASTDVFWITRDGAVEWLPTALDAPTFPVLLVGGAEGRPWLVARSASGRRLLRFDPWLEKFLEPEDAPLHPLPGFELADAPDNSDFQSLVVGTDPGLVLWLTKNSAERPVMFGFRHGTRGPYDAAVAPLLLANQDGVALDRSSRATGGGLSSKGEAVLTDVGETLVVTDTTYADLRLSIDPAGGPPPLVILFSPQAPPDERERIYGDQDCPWPAPPVDETPTPTPRLRRIGGEVTLSLGANETRCAGPSGRVSIWLRSPGGTVQVRSIDVKRSL